MNKNTHQNVAPAGAKTLVLKHRGTDACQVKSVVLSVRLCVVDVVCT